MKRKQFLTAMSLVAAMGMMALVSGAVFAKKTDDNKATITMIEGKASKSVKKTGPWKAIKKGSTLSANDYLKTADDSRVEVTFPDQSKLRIDQNSLVKMKSLMAGAGGKRKFDVHLQSGKVWATVRKAVGGEEKFNVTTENAVAGVRGTIFRVDYQQEAATVVRVYSGAVAVRNMPVYAKPDDIKKGKRVQVAGPQVITKKQWEELIAKEMQMVKVDADGRMSQADFSADGEAEDKWVQWNRKLDEQQNAQDREPVPEQ